VGAAVCIPLVMYLAFPVLPWASMLGGLSPFWLIVLCIPIVVIPAALVLKRQLAAMIQDSALVKSCGISILVAIAIYVWMDPIVRSWPLTPWKGYLLRSVEDAVTGDVWEISTPVCFGAFNFVLATGLAFSRKAVWRIWSAVFILSLLPAVLIALQLRQGGTADNFLAKPFVSAPVLFGWFANPVIFGFLLWSGLRTTAPKRERPT